MLCTNGTLAQYHTNINRCISCNEIHSYSMPRNYSFIHFNINVWFVKVFILFHDTQNLWCNFATGQDKYENCAYIFLRMAWHISHAKRKTIFFFFQIILFLCPAILNSGLDWVIIWSDSYNFGNHRPSGIYIYLFKFIYIYLPLWLKCDIFALIAVQSNK